MNSSSPYVKTDFSLSFTLCRLPLVTHGIVNIVRNVRPVDIREHQVLHSSLAGLVCHNRVTRVVQETFPECCRRYYRHCVAYEGDFRTESPLL